MAPEDREQSDGMGRIIPLRPRRTAPAPSRRSETGIPVRPSIGDLGRYERSDDRDDYRHRMIANGLAFLVCLFLIVAGVWLAEKMAEMRKNQDCVLSGRRGCTPVDVPVRSRW